MKNEVHDYCRELHGLLHADEYSLDTLREEPPDYCAQPAVEMPRQAGGACIANECTYQQLLALHVEVKLLRGLNVMHADGDFGYSVRLSRAALADCLDRLAIRLQEVLDGLRPPDA